ncbi:MAG: carbohydrate ABC transporter permease [Actinomyces ruminicola]|uniref:Multiple sugar transport system permease protein n=1 Tax=Actinomyces ruminicola TaxID=332524 RepID=A0A1G9ZKV5_9ACTO|nr:carbohydrate ABC transporter permease [Actinomyces ruminicola]MBE6481932.1 carbohydrate ABC transporter permease [Actinomyces ruminicola]SDN21276.1 multiple sugar transport system permease protein [Actinomyces ruminicola]
MSNKNPQAPVAHRGYNVENPRKSRLLTVVMGLMLIYTYLPLLWLFISSTKTQGDLFSTFGLWFGHDFALWDNVRETLTYNDGQFVRWFLNTLMYVILGAGGSVLLSVLAGYGLAKFDFPGKNAVFAIVIGAVAVPGTALAVPTFLMFAKLGLTNTPWSVIIPSLISPFGLYLMWQFTRDAVPTELLEAARIDGASEFRTFRQVALPLLGPGIVTVALFAIVATWNNYFLPLIMLKDASWYPLTIGLNAWNAQAATAGGQAIFNLVITASLLTIIPLIAAFLSLQRFWQAGLASGGVKE